MARYQLFYQGIFDFPAYPSVWLRWATLSVLGAVPQLMLASILRAVDSRYEGLWDGIQTVPFFGSLALLIAVAWFIVASAVSLAIVKDTAAGNDEIFNWPSAVWLDWTTDFLYLFNSLVFGSLIGLVVVYVCQFTSLTGVAVFATMVLLFFPILLLSMLEVDSPWGPVSLPVLRSLFWAADAWLVFYLMSGAFLALALCVSWIASQIRESAILSSAALVANAGVGSASLLVYFRLLGRLAFWCSPDRILMEDRIPHEREAPDDEDETDEEAVVEEAEGVDAH